MPVFVSQEGRRPPFVTLIDADLQDASLLNARMIRHRGSKSRQSWRIFRPSVAQHSVHFATYSFATCCCCLLPAWNDTESGRSIAHIKTVNMSSNTSPNDATIKISAAADQLASLEVTAGQANAKSSDSTDADPELWKPPPPAEAAALGTRLFLLSNATRVNIKFLRIPIRRTGPQG